MRVMHAALRTCVIGAIVVTVGGLGPLALVPAHAAPAHAAPAGGVARALDQPAGSSADPASGPLRPSARLVRAPAAPTCQASQLAIAPDLSSGATGHIALELRLHNASAHSCTLRGYATIVLLDGARRPLLTVLHWGPGGFFNNFNRPVRLVTLAPGGNAYVAMGWTHLPEPGQTCPFALNLLILPPGASSALLVALVHGGVDACGGQLAVSAVEPTHFFL